MSAASYRPHLMERHYASHLLQAKFQHPHAPGSSSLDKLDVEGSIHVHGGDAVPFLLTSGAPKNELRAMWAVADPDGIGTLTKRRQFQVLLRLIGMHEAGLLPPLHSSEESPEAVYADALIKYGSLEIALPSFDGLATPSPTFLIANYGGDDVSTSADNNMVAYGSGVLGGTANSVQNQQQQHLQASAFAMATDHDFQYHNWQQQQAIQSQQPGLAAPMPMQSVQCLSVSDAFGALVDVEDKLLPSDDFGDFTDAPEAATEAPKPSLDQGVPSNDSSWGDPPEKSYHPSSNGDLAATDIPSASASVTTGEVVPAADVPVLQSPAMNGTAASDQFLFGKNRDACPQTDLFNPVEPPKPEADDFGDFEGTSMTTVGNDLDAGERKGVLSHVMDSTDSETPTDVDQKLQLSFAPPNSSDPFVRLDPSPTTATAEEIKDVNDGFIQDSSTAVATGQNQQPVSNPLHIDHQDDSCDDFGNFEGVAPAEGECGRNSEDNGARENDSRYRVQNGNSHQVNFSEGSSVLRADEGAVETRNAFSGEPISRSADPFAQLEVPGTETAISDSAAIDLANAVALEGNNEDFRAFADAAPTPPKAPMHGAHHFSGIVVRSSEAIDDPFARLSGPPETVPAILDDLGEPRSSPADPSDPFSAPGDGERSNDNTTEEVKGAGVPLTTEGTEICDESFGTFEGPAPPETSFDGTTSILSPAASGAKDSNRTNSSSPGAQVENSNKMTDDSGDETSTAQLPSTTGASLTNRGEAGTNIDANSIGVKTVHENGWGQPEVFTPLPTNGEAGTESYDDPFGHLSVAPEPTFSGGSEEARTDQGGLIGLTNNVELAKVVDGTNTSCALEKATMPDVASDPPENEVCSGVDIPEVSTAKGDDPTGSCNVVDRTLDVDPFDHLSGASDPVQSSDELNQAATNHKDTILNTLDDRSPNSVPPLFSMDTSTSAGHRDDPFAHLSLSEEKPPPTLTMFAENATGRSEMEDEFGTFQDVGDKVANAGASVTDFDTADAEQFVEVTKMNQTQPTNLVSATDHSVVKTRGDDNDDDEFVLVSDQISQHEDTKLGESSVAGSHNNAPLKEGEAFGAVESDETPNISPQTLSGEDSFQGFTVATTFDQNPKGGGGDEDEDDFGDFETHAADEARKDTAPPKYANADLLSFQSVGVASDPSTGDTKTNGLDLFTSFPPKAQSPSTAVVFDAAFDDSLLSTNEMGKPSLSVTEPVPVTQGSSVTENVGDSNETALDHDGFADFQAFEEAEPGVSKNAMEPDASKTPEQGFKADFGDFSEPQQGTADHSWSDFGEPQKLPSQDTSYLKMQLQGMREELASILNPPSMLLERNMSDSCESLFLSFFDRGVDATFEADPNVGVIRWRANRCLTLHKVIATEQHAAKVERWFDIVGSVTKDLDLCRSLFRAMNQSPHLSSTDQEQIAQSDTLFCFLHGLGEAVRIVRYIAAVVGDLLFLDEKTELTRGSLTEWGSLNLLGRILEVEELWLEVLAVAASAHVRRMPESIETVPEIRRKVSLVCEMADPPTHENSNHFCHITLQFLPQLMQVAEPLGEPMHTVTSSGVTFMACAANYCLNRLSSPLCDE